MSRKFKFKTVYHEVDGQRQDVPALKGLDASEYDDTALRVELADHEHRIEIMDGQIADNAKTAFRLVNAKEPYEIIKEPVSFQFEDYWGEFEIDMPVEDIAGLYAYGAVMEIKFNGVEYTAPLCSVDTYGDEDYKDIPFTCGPYEYEGQVLFYFDFADESGEVNIEYARIVFSDTIQADDIVKKYVPMVNDDNSVAYGNNTASAFAFAEGFSNHADGGASHVEGYNNRAEGGNSHAEGGSTLAKGYDSHSEGVETKANGFASHAEGCLTEAKHLYSHSEGQRTSANGYSSHAEGYWSVANGYASHAEGWLTNAYTRNSHAEGCQTFSGGWDSHTEGFNTKALHNQTHAGGIRSVASGNQSFAHGETAISLGDYSTTFGMYTTATRKSQFVSGRYNVLDDSKVNSTTSQYVFVSDEKTKTYTIPEPTPVTVSKIAILSKDPTLNNTTVPSTEYTVSGNSITFVNALESDLVYYVTYTGYGSASNGLLNIVGNGTSASKRSNAHTLDLNGNAWFSGDVYVGSTSGTNKDNGSKKLMTGVGVGGMVTMTQAEYNALATKDPNTMYVIVG